MSGTRLTIAVDVKHPYVYLGFEGISVLLDETGVEAEWRPLIAAPLKAPVAPGPGADRGERHRYLRARYSAMDVRRYAERRGLVIRGLHRAPDSSAFAAVLLWLGGHRREYVREWLGEVLREYWAERLDVEDPAALLGVAQGLGIGTAGASAWVEGDGRRAAARADAELRAAGVFAVPGFVLDGEPYLGRQHLPMLRWIITGREGPGPI